MSKHRFAVGESVCLKGSGAIGVVQSRLVNLDTQELVYTVRSEFNYSGPIIPEALLLSIEEQVEVAERIKQESDDREQARYQRRIDERKATKEASHV